MSDDKKHADWSPMLFDRGSGILPPANHAPGVTKRTIVQAERARRRIGRMHAKHGHGPEGATCADCSYFRRYKTNRVYFKCQLYGVSRSEATDWRAGWPACGLFQLPKPVAPKGHP